MFEETRILVTGSSGFLGTHLCKALIAEGATVYGISRSPHSDADELRWSRLDLTDAESVQKYFERISPEIVFHLASRVTGSRSLDEVLPTFESNLGGTVNLLTAAARTNCCRRVVLAGSMEEPEVSMNMVPSSPYAAAKQAASLYARLFAALYDLPVVVCRLFMVYGPGQMDLRKLVPYAIMSFLEERRPELSSGKRRIDWIYVDDVVRGLLACAQSEAAVGKTIELGSGRLTTIRDLIEQLGETMGTTIQPQFGARPDRPFEVEPKADIKRSQSITGWKPEIELREGLSRTVQWYASKAAAERN